MTVADAVGAKQFTVVIDGSTGTNVKQYLRSTPGGAWTAIGCMAQNAIPVAGGTSFGIFVKESTSGKIITCAADAGANSGSGAFIAYRYTNQTTWLDSLSGFVNWSSFKNLDVSRIWFKIAYDGSSNLTFYVSVDSRYWYQIGTTTISASFGGTAPDQLGVFFCNQVTSGAVHSALLIHWSVG